MIGEAKLMLAPLIAVGVLFAPVLNAFPDALRIVHDIIVSFLLGYCVAS